MGLEGVLQTMKGDASDQGTAYQVRACLEEGPEALLASDLFTPKERQLWKAYFDEQEGAWEAMQQHLIETHQLPFRAAPPGELTTTSAPRGQREYLCYEEAFQ